MGAGEVTAAAVDAGPLIHWAEINALPLLRIFDTLHIPDAVWNETVEHGRVPARNILTSTTVQRYTLSPSAVEQLIRDHSLEELHIGELECLCLCKQIGVSIVLTDDLAARDAAKRLSIVPVGSLGIVVRACRLGHVPLSEAERHLVDLYDMSSLFVTRAIVELAIEQLRRQSA